VPGGDARVEVVGGLVSNIGPHCDPLDFRTSRVERPLKLSRESLEQLVQTRCAGAVAARALPTTASAMNVTRSRARSAAVLIALCSSTSPTVTGSTALMALVQVRASSTSGSMASPTARRFPWSRRPRSGSRWRYRTWSRLVMPRSESPTLMAWSRNVKGAPWPKSPARARASPSPPRADSDRRRKGSGRRSNAAPSGPHRGRPDRAAGAAVDWDVPVH